jgi:hypothetical protein
MTFNAADVGWRLGRSVIPRGIELWCPYDRTTGVFGEQGSGKTLDILAPALLAHPGAAMATLTKLDDLLLTAGRRQRPLDQAGGAAGAGAGKGVGVGGGGGLPRPIAVLDPFGAAPGLPEFVWDPVDGRTVPPASTPPRPRRSCKGSCTRPR